MDPKLLRGKSSQLNFDIQASGKQIDSIKRSFKDLSIPTNGLTSNRESWRKMIHKQKSSSDSMDCK